MYLKPGVEALDNKCSGQTLLCELEKCLKYKFKLKGYTDFNTSTKKRQQLENDRSFRWMQQINNWFFTQRFVDDRAKCARRKILKV